MYSMYSDPNVNICFSQVFIYKSLIQCLRILEVNLKLEVRMSFKIQLTELSSLHIVTCKGCKQHDQSTTEDCCY